MQAVANLHGPQLCLHVFLILISDLSKGDRHLSDYLWQVLPQSKFLGHSGAGYHGLAVAK